MSSVNGATASGAGERPAAGLRAQFGRLVGTRWVGPIAVLAIAAAAAGTALSSEGYYTFVLATVAIHVVVGVGLNILLGLSGQVSFGHVGFFAIGAYATGILMLEGFGFWSAFALAGLVSAACGFALALPALRVTGPYLAMMTIAFAFIVEHGAIEWRELTGGANGLMGFSGPTLFGHVLDDRGLALLAVALAAIALLFFHVLARGAWGQAMRAVRDSEVAARSLGLDPVAVKTVSFTLSALLTGLAGALFAPLNMFISPGSFPFFQSILFVLIVMVGGAGTLLGPVVGAAVVVLLPEVLSGLAEYRLLFFGALMLGVLWLAPRGVVGALAGWLAREDPRTAGDAAPDPGPALAGEASARPPLEVRDLEISFGGVRAATDVGFVAEPGRITSVIGPNGAGKTTVLNVIGGYYRPDRGSVRLGDELAGRPAHRVARAGVARTFQTTQLFEHFGVLDNVLVGLRRGRLGWLLARAASPDDRALAEALLAFVGYSGPLARRAGELPHVDRRLVEVARALATRPAVLLLDEPAAGLAREDKQRLGALLRRIADFGVVLILVEHDMSLVMDVSDHVVVLDAGVPLMTGTPAEVRADPAVHRAYLGGTEFEGRARETPWQGPAQPLLATRGLSAAYGAAPAVRAVDLAVRAGETVAVLGANGASKSTLMRAIAGLHRPVEGEVALDRERIERRPAHAIAAAGLSLVPEGRQVFPELSVRDNLVLGGHGRRERVGEEEIDALLDRFPRLRERLSARAGVLSGGEQQMLAIARGLIARPKVLLLDEPSLGLAPSMVAELYRVLADLRDEHTTVLVVDQIAHLALAVADRGYVLENGRVAHAGPAERLRGDPAIERAYLGE
jgi:branched-chain amino acid transport system permease protein